MDRLKFRVFDKEQNKYIESVKIKDEDSGVTFYYYHFMIDREGRLCANRADCLDGYAGSDSVQYMDSDRFIVEQCTGISDKTGKLIYDNDRVKACGKTGVVKFGFYRKTDEHFPDAIYGFYIEWDNDFLYRQDFGYWVTEGLEIIGNVHEKEKK